MTSDLYFINIFSQLLVVMSNIITKSFTILEGDIEKGRLDARSILIRFDQMDPSAKTIEIQIDTEIRTEQMKRLRIEFDDNDNIKIFIMRITDYEIYKTGQFSELSIKSANNLIMGFYINKTSTADGWTRKNFGNNIDNLKLKFKPTFSIPNISFAAVGDFGDSDEKEEMTKTFKTIRNSPADFLLALGDLYYENKLTQDWINIINRDTTLKRLYGEENNPKRNIYPIFGNHDTGTDQDEENRTQIIKKFRGEEIFSSDINETNPEKIKGYYTFKKQNIFFIMMDTEDSLGKGSTQHDFVRASLKTASEDSSVKWKVVCLHFPSVTTKGDHHAPSEIVQKDYHNLFDDFKVDLILSGHNHNFFMTRPINHSNSPDGNKPDVTVATDGPYNNVNGRIFATIGTGGHELRSFGNNSKHYDDNNHVLKMIEKFGIMLVKLQNNGSELIGFFRDNSDTDVKLFELRKS